MRHEYPKVSATIQSSYYFLWLSSIDGYSEAVKAKLGPRQFLQVLIRVNALNVSFCEKRDESARSEDMRRLAPGIESLAPGLFCQPQVEGLQGLDQ